MVKLTRGPGGLLPAANRHQRHQRIADQHFIGLPQRLGTRCHFDNAKRRWCQLRDTALPHNAVDPGIIESRSKYITSLTPE